MMYRFANVSFALFVILLCHYGGGVGLTLVTAQ